jgi:hypothetical protein
MIEDMNRMTLEANNSTTVGVATERRFAQRSTVLPTSHVGQFSCTRGCNHTACGRSIKVQLDLQVRNDFYVTVVRIDNGPANGLAWIGDTRLRIDANGSARLQHLVDPIPAPLQVSISDADGQSIGFVFAETTD